MDEPTLAGVYARSKRVVGRRVGDGFVLVPLVGRGADLDSIFELNTTAAFVWERLDGEQSGHRIVTAVVERFEVEAEEAVADYLELIAALGSIGALEAAGGEASSSPTR